MADAIKTVKQLRDAIRTAGEVLVQPRFGNTERWIHVTKAEALLLVRGMSATLEAKDIGMAVFAFTDGHKLFVGE